MQLTATWLPADQPDPQQEHYLRVATTAGSYLITHDGAKIYDAISSWWCKPLGHAHPIIQHSLKQQLALFDHHIPAKAWNETIENLSRKLVSFFPSMDKVMYASDGSSAMEIAMKLSYETRVLAGQPEKHKFIALSGAYHGETILTLSVCGINSYTANYQRLLAENYFIDAIPYVSGKHDPLWHDCQFDFAQWKEFFAHHAPLATALILEPIVQGALGMKIISADFLRKIIALAKKYNLHIIADEIMVGLGRLGCYSVCYEMLNVEPDIACFAKNLTAGSIPMSAVVINRSISDVFRNQQQVFHHSHTHSCNGLAAAIANSYLDYLATSDLLGQVKQAEIRLVELITKLAKQFSFVDNPRAIGAIAACELNLPQTILGQIHQLALAEQLYLRLIGTTLYILPPLYNLATDLEIIQAKLVSLLRKLA